MDRFEKVMRAAFIQAKICKNSKTKTVVFFDHKNGEEYCILTIQQVRLLKKSPFTVKENHSQQEVQHQDDKSISLNRICDVDSFEQPVDTSQSKVKEKLK